MVFTITAYKVSIPFPPIYNQSIPIYLSIGIDNRYQSITTRIFAIDWYSIININRIIDIDWYRLILIVIDYRFHRLDTPGLSYKSTEQWLWPVCCTCQFLGVTDGCNHQDVMVSHHQTWPKKTQKEYVKTLVKTYLHVPSRITIPNRGQVTLYFFLQFENLSWWQSVGGSLVCSLKGWKGSGAYSQHQTSCSPPFLLKSVKNNTGSGTHKDKKTGFYWQ